jgi:putative hydrolase of the HAD superfamily
MKYQNIICDMDDTLLPCGPFYVKAQKDFAEFQNERTGLPHETCLDLMKHIDLVSITLPNAFNRERYPRSFKAASYVIDMLANDGTLDIEAAHKSFDIGNSVFSAPYDLFEGVQKALEILKVNGYNLFLLTKGDENIQNEKIDRNSLRDIFTPDHIYIVPKKNGQNIVRIIREHDLDPKETIMVGDSLRDDVGSAIEAGISSAWVHENANKSWAYENTDHTPTYTIDHFPEIITVVNPVAPRYTAEQLGDWLK